MPAHVTLAVVLQVRDGELQALLWQRARAPFKGSWALAGRLPRPGRHARGLDPPAPRGEGRRAGALASRAARDAERSEALAAGVAAGDGLSRARAERRRPRAPRRHGLAPGRRPPHPRVRPRLDRARRTGTSAGEAVVHEPGLRARACGVHDLRAPRPLRGRARTRRVGDESPASPAPARSARADRPPAGVRARRAAVPARSSASARSELEITDQFAVLRPPGPARLPVA